MQISTDRPSTRHLARIVFATFLFTFIASRVLVILIMGRYVPDLFLHMGQTHVHHLNYGIFLLSFVGGLLLFIDVGPRERLWCAVAYGFGLALTFDEFGMWLHLGGGYWQRASFDAVIVVLSLLGLIAFRPPLDRMRAHHWVTGVLVLVSTVFFYFMLFKSLDYAGKKFGPHLEMLEKSGSPINLAGFIWQLLPEPWLRPAESGRQTSSPSPSPTQRRSSRDER